MTTDDTIPPPDSAPVDVEAFREQMRDAGVESVVPQILATFAADLSNQASLLRSAMEDGDPKVVASRAHGFKSASGSVHAYRLQAILSELETRAGASGIEACAALANEAFDEIERVRDHLATLDLP